MATARSWLRNYRNMLCALANLVLGLMVIVDGSDVFDSTRQGGDKSPPTPVGSAVWWLLMNSSTLPNYGWSNGTSTNFSQTTTMSSLFANNATTIAQTWTPLNLSNSGTTTTASSGSSLIWSNSGDSSTVTAPTPAAWIMQLGNTTSSFPTNLTNGGSQANTTNFVTTTVAPPFSPPFLANFTSGQNASQTVTVLIVGNSSMANQTTMQMTTALPPWILGNTTVVITSTIGSTVNGTASGNASTPVSVASRETREPPLDQYPAACRRLNDAELYTKLKERGGYNQYFMANSPDEVGQLPGFRLSDDTRDYSDKLLDTFRRVQRATNPDPQLNQQCVGRCKKISRIVQNAMDDFDTPVRFMSEKGLARDAYGNPWIGGNRTNEPSEQVLIALGNGTTTNSSATVTASTPTTTTITPPRPAQKYGLISGLCRLEHFIPIGDCDFRSGGDDADFARLCTACRGVYKLPRGCFPQFLNAITCNATDNQCIYDRWSKSPHGTCREETLTFTVMHNLGREECQEWRFESVEVPIACQCYLSRSSWLEP